MNIERLQKYFGEQLLFCETLSTYLCGHGTLPSHLVNDNIFIADIGNGLELFKIGKTQKIVVEYNAILEINSVVCKQDQDFKVPEVYDIYHFNSEESALRMSFEGRHTLEYQGITELPTTVLNITKKIIQKLKDYGFIWYAVSPKNIVLCEKKESLQKFCILDWEHGAIRLDENCMKHYCRFMQLREEWMTFGHNIFPYWSSAWPHPAELLMHTGEKELMKMVDINEVVSRRIKLLFQICNLPNYVTDAAYMRALTILSSLSNMGYGTTSRLLFAADFISELGYSKLRVYASMLSWYLQQEKIDNGMSELSQIILRAGINCEVNKKPAIINSITKPDEINSTNNKIYEIGYKFLGKNWISLLSNICREYVLAGNNQQKKICQFEQCIVLVDI